MSKMLGLCVYVTPLCLGHVATFANLSLDDVVGLSQVCINDLLVVEINARCSEERDQDHGKKRGR